MTRQNAGKSPYETHVADWQKSNKFTTFLLQICCGELLALLRGVHKNSSTVVSAHMLSGVRL